MLIKPITNFQERLSNITQYESAAVMRNTAGKLTDELNIFANQSIHKPVKNKLFTYINEVIKRAVSDTTMDVFSSTIKKKEVDDKPKTIDTNITEVDDKPKPIDTNITEVKKNEYIKPNIECTVFLYPIKSSYPFIESTYFNHILKLASSVGSEFNNPEDNCCYWYF